MANALATLFLNIRARSVDLATDLRKAERQITKVGRQFERTGAMLTRRFSVPVGLAMLAASKSFLDFDEALVESMAKMRGVTTTTDAFGKALKENLADRAKEVASITRFSMVDIAGSYKFLAEAGFDAASSMKVVENVAMFAQAGAMDLKQATDLLTDSTVALGLSMKNVGGEMKRVSADELATNMQRVADVITKVSLEAATSVQQAMRAITTRAGVEAKQAGLNIEQVGAAILVLAQNGVKGERAGHQLAVVLRDLARKAAMNASVWKELGINVFDATGKSIKPLSAIFAEVEDAFDGMTLAQKSMALGSLKLQDRTQSQFKLFIGFSSVLKKWEERLKEAGGTVHRVAKVQMEAFKRQLELLMNRLQVLGVEIGEIIVPVLMDLAESLIEVLESFKKLDPWLKKLLVWSTMTAAALGPLIWLFGSLLTSLTSIGKFLAMVFVPITFKSAKALEEAEKQGRLLGKAGTKLLVVLGTLITPFSVFVTALIAGGVALVVYRKEVAETTRKGLRAIKEFASDATAYIKGFSRALDEDTGVITFAQSIIDAFVELGEALADLVREDIQIIKALVRDYWPGIKEALIEGIESWYDSTVQSKINTAFNVINDLTDGGLIRWRETMIEGIRRMSIGSGSAIDKMFDAWGQRMRRGWVRVSGWFDAGSFEVSLARAEEALEGYKQALGNLPSVLTQTEKKLADYHKQIENNTLENFNLRIALNLASEGFNFVEDDAKTAATAVEDLTFDMDSLASGLEKVGKASLESRISQGMLEDAAEYLDGLKRLEEWQRKNAGRMADDEKAAKKLKEAFDKLKETHQDFVKSVKEAKVAEEIEEITEAALKAGKSFDTIKDELIKKFTEAAHLAYDAMIKAAGPAGKELGEALIGNYLKENLRTHGKEYADELKDRNEEIAKDLYDKQKEAYDKSIEFWRKTFENAITGVTFDLEDALKQVAVGFAAELATALVGGAPGSISSPQDFGGLLGTILIGGLRQGASNSLINTIWGQTATGAATGAAGAAGMGIAGGISGAPAGAVGSAVTEWGTSGYLMADGSVVAAGFESALASFVPQLAAAFGAYSLYDSAMSTHDVFSSGHRPEERGFVAGTAALDTLFPGIGTGVRELGQMVGLFDSMGDAAAQSREGVERWIEDQLHALEATGQGLEVFRQGTLEDFGTNFIMGPDDRFNLEGWADTFWETWGKNGADAFHAVGLALTEFLGIEEDIGGQLSMILAENLGSEGLLGNLDNIKLFLDGIGVSTEDLTQALFQMAEAGAISFHEFEVFRQSLEQIPAEGLAASGDYMGAMDIVLQAGGRGQRALQGLQALAIEAGQAGIESLEGLRTELEGAGVDTTILEGLFEGFAQRGITSLEELANATGPQLGGVIADIETALVEAGRGWDEFTGPAEDARDRLKDLEDSAQFLDGFQMNLKVHLDYENEELLVKALNQTNTPPLPPFTGNKTPPIQNAKGGVVSGPKLFQFGRGAAAQFGLMGERGPEGILPLTNVGGKLGVSAAGLASGGGSSSVVYNVHVANGYPGVETDIVAALQKVRQVAVRDSIETFVDMRERGQI